MGDGTLVEITVNGHRRTVRSDRPLLHALAQEKMPVLGRSLKYHRPRGPVCGSGQCAGCLVRVNGEPSVRSCLRVPHAGDTVILERGWPSTHHDLFAVFDRLFPSHMDTMHGFTRPAFLRSIYTGFVRRFSGQGQVPDELEGPLPPLHSQTVEVLVVGGGRAANAAGAIARQALSASQVLQVGGATSSTHPYALLHLPPPDHGTFEGLVYREGYDALRVRARRVILATGAYDASLIFPGNDLPGVITGDGAEALGSIEPSPPFHRALVFGGGPRAAEICHRFKDRVAVVASPGAVSPELERELQGSKIPTHPGSLVCSASGRAGVRTVVLRDRTSGSHSRFAVDAVILAHRRLPHVSTLFQAGARMAWRNDPGAYYPVLSDDLETSVPGLFAAGEVAGFHRDSELEPSAERAARSALGLGEPSSPSASNAPSREPAGGPCPMLQYYSEFLTDPPRQKTLLCPCEDVCLDELDGVVREGWGGLETAKRISGVGMGLCQGRYCVPETILLLALKEKRDPEDIGFITQRPPIWPTPVGALAGEREEAQ